MIVEINPQHPQPRKIDRAVEALKRGGVIAYPTDTVYGLGCDLFNKKATDRLYQIKGAKKTQRMAFVCAELAQVARYAIVDDYAYRILKRHLPGPYCFIMDATREVPKMIQTNRKTVGIRVPDNPVAIAIVEALGGPIISTTAARHDEEPDPDARELDARFPQLDLILDAGACGLTPSSVIDLTGNEPVVIREGAGDCSEFS